jgi:hypothetical protein
MRVKVSDPRRHRVALRQENLALTTYLIQLFCFCRMHTMTWFSLWITPRSAPTSLELSSFWFKEVEVKVTLYFSATRRHSLLYCQRWLKRITNSYCWTLDLRTEIETVEFSPILTRGKRLKVENLGFQKIEILREPIFWHRKWLQYENIPQNRHFMGTYPGSWMDNDAQ